VTVISLQPGEELGTVAAGGTPCGSIVSDTSSSNAADLRVNVLVKPIRSGLKTNLVITTSRRTYLLELTPPQKTSITRVSRDYPRDRMPASARAKRKRPTPHARRYRPVAAKPALSLSPKRHQSTVETTKRL